MDYQTAQVLVDMYLSQAKSGPFIMNQKTCEFLAFVISPKDSEMELLRNLFIETTQREMGNENLLRMFGLASKELRVFIAYLPQGGVMDIVPFNPDFIEFSK